MAVVDLSLLAHNAISSGDIIDGRYQILHKLATGGMGTVFLAEHVLIRRRVALKVLHTELAGDTAMVKRFMNEARAAGTLGHPHIVESTDMGFLPDGTPFIVFEYLEGSVLCEAIYLTHGMPVARALRIARQTASALEAAHEAGIVHLDLKSDNIFVTDRDGAADHVKVLDFGISKFMEADPDRTQRGLVVGTPGCMAPEQVTMPDLVDKRADIYALGIVLYEMLTARRPFGTHDPRILLYRICNEPPPPLARAGIPAALEQLVVHGLLAKDRDDRLQSMQEVIAALEAIEHAMLEPRPPAPPVVDVHADRRPGAGWVVAGLLAATAAGGARHAQTRLAGATNDGAVLALRVDADKIAAVFDAEARAAHLRARGIAGMPLLRAAIETDRATVLDLAHHEPLFTPVDGEVIELIQRGHRSLLRLPETTAPLEVTVPSKIASIDGTVRMVVGEPVRRRDGTDGGTVAVSVPVDLTLIRRLVAEDSLEASLVGLGPRVALVTPAADLPAPDGIPVIIPIPVQPALFDGPLDLVATVQPATRGHTFRLASLAAAATSALCFVGLAASRRRRRLSPA